jgi:hypothetical protein
MQNEKFSSPELFGYQQVTASTVFVNMDELSNTSPFAPIIADAAAQIFSALPAMGIGSDSRIRKTEAVAEANISANNAKATADRKAQLQKNILYIFCGLFVVIVFIIWIALKA